MAIQLTDDRPASYPVLRNQLIGEMAQIAIIRTEQRDRVRKDPSTNTFVKIQKGSRPDGSPKYAQELIIHGLAMPGTTMEVKIGDDFRAPMAGERIRMILKGQSFGKFIEARKSHRNGNLNVGDVLITGTDQAQAYDQDGQPKGQPITDQQTALKVPRGTTLGFYGPIELAEPVDMQWVSAAEEAYLADQRQIQEAKAIPAAEPVRRSWDDDDMPY